MTQGHTSTNIYGVAKVIGDIQNVYGSIGNVDGNVFNFCDENASKESEAKRQRLSSPDTNTGTETETGPENTSDPTADTQSDEALSVFLTQNAPDVVLHSGTSLRQFLNETLGLPDNTTKTFQARRIIFVQSKFFQKHLSCEDFQELGRLVPAAPRVPPYFLAVMEACQPYLKNPSNSAWLSCPPAADDQDPYIMSYIFGAIMHISIMKQRILNRAPSHGEVWHEVNIWNTILDWAFLRSDVLTIDRKELNHQAVVAASRKYDGILRTVGRQCRIDLGFIEVKPKRCPYESSSDSDREKVIQAMIDSLVSISVSDVIVSGIICNGLAMTIWRGRMDLGNIFFFKEATFDLEKDLCIELPRLLTACWRLKLSLEQSVKVIDACPSLQDFD